MNFHPFKIDIPEREIFELKQKLSATRLPEKETVDDWSQGVPRGYLAELCSYWINNYDWYETQNRLNRINQGLFCIEGMNIHYVEVKSKCDDAKPLLLTHGWPGSFLEFEKIIDPLTNPVEYGIDSKIACHVICPTLPGFGFSGKPIGVGWNVDRIAKVWDALMKELGYDIYFAQGGDWGAGITLSIAALDLGSCRSVHVNMPTAGPTKEAFENPSPRDLQTLKRIEEFREWGSGYHKQQSTRPQTLGFGLADSPVGQAAWILEKFYEWTDCSGHPENIFSKNELLDNIMLYWLTNSAASSARLYWETFSPSAILVDRGRISIPVGVSVFPKEIMAGPRSWSEKHFADICYWSELDRGGHFAALEQPDLFVSEIKKWLAIVG